MRKVKKIVFAIFSIVAIVVLTIKFDYNNANAFSDIITFFSIAAGFNITALSIIANSQFSARLYNIEDTHDNSKTLLHNLVEKFKSSTVVFLITIALILSFLFINGNDPNEVHSSIDIKSITLTFPKILKSIIWYLTALSFFRFYDLIIAFSKVVIRSSPKN